ncbi:MAG: imidazole glycerol phosphate synthase subunit HisH [Bacteroidales bacterium]|nr:imidazole glycerol phosphate synthase subunit HisH [Bacteroidales bacterium]
MNKNIVIIDYGLGNIESIKYKLELFGYYVSLSNSAEIILKADLLILPGVGHFAKGMENLKNSGLIETLNTAVLELKKPIIGICLGMQLMTSFSEEGNVHGLNWVEAITQKFNFSDNTLKIPNVGWRSINIMKESEYFENIMDTQEFYFTHSYYINCYNKEDILAQTIYGHPFTSVFQKNNILGVQFHPEKSHKSGFRVLLNFVEKNL